MKRLLLILLIAIPVLATASFAQTKIKAKAGINAVINQAKTDGISDPEVFVIATASGQYSTFTISFDMNAGKASAWVYIVRSKSNTEIVKAYVAINILIMIVQEIPYGDIAGMLPLQPEKSLQDVTFYDSDEMITRMSATEEFQAAKSLDPNINVKYTGLGVNPGPLYTPGDPYWMTTFTAATETLECVLNASNGTVMCRSFAVSVREDLKNKFAAYPIPASGFVFLSIPAEIQSPDYKLELINETGVSMGPLYAPSFGETDRLMIPLDNYPSGTYFVKYKTNSGEYVEKIVIAK